MHPGAGEAASNPSAQTQLCERARERVILGVLHLYQQVARHARYRNTTLGRFKTKRRWIVAT